MAAPLVFPESLAREVNLLWALRGGVVESPQPIGGGPPPQPVVTSGGPYWECQWRDIRIATEEQELAWRALEVRLQLGAAGIVVPRLSRRGLEPVDPAASSPEWRSSFSNGRPFSNGELFSSRAITVATLADASLRATRLRLSITEGRGLRTGEEFTVRHPNKGARMYRISEVEEDAGSTTQPWVHIGPPLREATAAGTELDFAYPRCLMRLSGTTDLTMRLRTEGSASVTFVELFRR